MLFSWWAELLRLELRQSSTTGCDSFAVHHHPTVKPSLIAYAELFGLFCPLESPPAPTIIAFAFSNTELTPSD